MNMSLDERDSRQDQRGRELFKKHQRIMEQLKDAPIAKVRAITNRDYAILGELLNRQMDESNGNLASLGPVANLAMQVVSLVYGASPVGELAATQMLNSRNGFVLFKDFEAVNTRGDVTAGQKLMSALGVPDVYQKSYANNTVQDEPLVADSNGVAAYTDLQIGGTDELMAPLYNRDMTVRASIVFTTANGAITFAPMVVDHSTGKFSAVKDNGGSPCWISGTVNFENGEVDIDLSSDPDGQTNIWITYQVLAESAVDVPRGTLKFQDKPVRAEWYALASDYGLFEQYAMQKEYNLNIEEEIVKDLSFAINSEICNKVIAKIVANVPGGNLTTFYRKPLQGVSPNEQALVLRQALNDADSKLLTTAGRGSVTCWAVGRKAAARFRDLPEFKLLFEQNTYGPHIYGTLEGVTVVRFPANDQLDEDFAIGIARLSDMEAPVVQCPYMGLTTTDVLQQGLDNPLRRQKAVATATAIEVMVPNLSTKLVIDESNFYYGSNS